MSKPLTFILNDETHVNSFGFRIKNAGIKLERFRENPVMLAQHLNSVWMVIGRWINLRFEGSCLLADAEFDEEDPEAKKIAGKVKRNFIKGCSLGILFDPQKMKLAADNNFELLETEVMENSIVAVPSNARAVRLFAADGHEFSESEVKLSLSALSTQIKPNNINTNNIMEKIILSAAAVVALAGVGITSADDIATISRGVEELASKLNTVNASLTAEKAAHELTKTSLTALSDGQANALVDGAISEGKLTADLKDQFVQMAKTNYALAAKVIGAMTGKVNLSGKVSNSAADASDPKTMDEFEKLTVAKQLAFKSDNPDAYKALFA